MFVEFCLDHIWGKGGNFRTLSRIKICKRFNDQDAELKAETPVETKDRKKVAV